MSGTTIADAEIVYDDLPTKERLDFIFKETDWRITNDQFLGTQEVAFKKIELEINKSNIDGHNTFEISYQGCSEGTYCYPVVKKEIKI